MDTSNILFICGGAFAGLDKVINARGRGTTIGFGADVKDLTERGVGDAFKDLETEDLVRYGLIPEFIGRLPITATLEDLDEDALVQILTKPKNALTKQFQVLFGMENVDLTFTDAALIEIAKKAIATKTGARGLRSIIENLLLDTMYEIPDEKDVNEVIISDKTITTDAEPERMTSKAKKSKKKAGA